MRGGELQGGRGALRGGARRIMPRGLHRSKREAAGRGAALGGATGIRGALQGSAGSAGSRGALRGARGALPEGAPRGAAGRGGAHYAARRWYPLLLGGPDCGSPLGDIWASWLPCRRRTASANSLAQVSGSAAGESSQGCRRRPDPISPTRLAAVPPAARPRTPAAPAHTRALRYHNEETAGRRRSAADAPTALSCCRTLAAAGPHIALGARQPVRPWAPGI